MLCFILQSEPFINALKKKKDYTVLKLNNIMQDLRRIGKKEYKESIK